VAEEPGTSTALATVRHERFALALEPSNVSNAYTLAKHLYNSGLFRAHSNPDSIFAVIMTGRTMGLDALTSLRGMHIIEGKPQISAALMVGMVLRSGLAEYFECIESTDERATWETKRVGARKERKESFTMKDADVAGYTRKSNSGKPTQWQKGPRTMLRWRAAAELAREVYPDVVSNVYIPGELEEAS
jgi:hypothetical protein